MSEDRISKRLKKLAAELADLATAIDAEPTNGWEGDIATRAKAFDAARVMRSALADREKYLLRRARNLQQDVEEAASEAAFADGGRRELERDARRAP